VSDRQGVATVKELEAMKEQRDWWRARSEYFEHQRDEWRTRATLDTRGLRLLRWNDSKFASDEVELMLAENERLRRKLETIAELERDVGEGEKSERRIQN